MAASPAAQAALVRMFGVQHANTILAASPATPATPATGPSIHPVTGTGSGDQSGQPAGLGTPLPGTDASDPLGIGNLFASAFSSPSTDTGLGGASPSATDLATADQIAANQAAAQANPPTATNWTGIAVVAGVAVVGYLVVRHFKRKGTG